MNQLTDTDSTHPAIPTLADFEDADYAAFCSEVSKPAVLHRKRWEWWRIARTIENGVHLRGASGLGFGCGAEPMPAFFTARGATVHATDLPSDDERARPWIASGYDMSKLSGQSFTTSFVDMTKIPSELRQGQFDFVWSSCSLEHLGSLDAGIEYILNAMECLKPNGIAVHTTEYNVSSNGKTIETPDLSIYRRRDLVELDRRLRDRRCTLRPLSFDQGPGVVPDRLPFATEDECPLDGDRQHINLVYGRYEMTSLVLVVRAPPDIERRT